MKALGEYSVWYKHSKWGCAHPSELLRNYFRQLEMISESHSTMDVSIDDFKLSILYQSRLLIVGSRIRIPLRDRLQPLGLYLCHYVLIECVLRPYTLLA